jgi:hypothetical protein
LKILILSIIILIVNLENIELFIKDSFYLLNNSESCAWPAPTIMSGIIPLKIYDNLTNNENLRSDLHRVGGVYGLVNISNPKKIKQYSFGRL